MSDQPFQSFSEFYPYYLDEHRDRNCRRLHFVGSLLVLAVLASVLLTGAWWWLLAIPVIGYGFAWVGHFFFEKNRPATFKYPLYSLMGDWVMFRDILIGRIPF
ncbi:Mpo1-like protein [Marinobacter sp. M1N3S26]|uniref:Mpo1-like protein n=1 Tax=unclassified Marinobacter TaxID=83889 RepID=UPI00387B9BE2